jgi:hypothetical protein
VAVKSRVICQISLIVDDLDAVVANYVKTFNLPSPEIKYLPKPDSVPSFMDGAPGDYSDCRMAVLKFDNMVFEVTQPGKNDSPWKRWLDEHGSGVQHIGFLVDEKDKDEAFKTLGDLGCSMYHAGFYPDLTYTFVDGFKAFGLDFNIKWNTNNREKIADFLQHPDKHLEEI